MDEEEELVQRRALEREKRLREFLEKKHKGNQKKMEGKND